MAKDYVEEKEAKIKTTSKGIVILWVFIILFISIIVRCARY